MQEALTRFTQHSDGTLVINLPLVEPEDTRPEVRRKLNVSHGRNSAPAKVIYSNVI